MFWVQVLVFAVEPCKMVLCYLEILCRKEVLILPCRGPMIPLFQILLQTLHPKPRLGALASCACAALISDKEKDWTNTVVPRTSFGV